jgi:predicted nucleic acid-binding Zn finger protein
MSKDLLFDVYSIAKKKGVIDDELINFIDTIFPNKADKVLDVIKKGITKYTYKPSNRVIWLALGENREYLIYPKLYCSCLNFYKEVVINQSIGYCKHLITQIICEALNKYKKVELKDKEFEDLINNLESKF